MLSRTTWTMLLWLRLCTNIYWTESSMDSHQIFSLFISAANLTLEYWNGTGNENPVKNSSSNWEYKQRRKCFKWVAHFFNFCFFPWWKNLSTFLMPMVESDFHLVLIIHCFREVKLPLNSRTLSALIGMSTTTTTIFWLYLSDICWCWKTMCVCKLSKRDEPYSKSDILLICPLTIATK